VRSGQTAAQRVTTLVIAGLASWACDAQRLDVGAWSPDAGLSVEAGTAADVDVPANSGRYIEAESGELSGGFSIGDDPSASRQRYIAPPAAVTSEQEPGSARARYVFQVSSPGAYLIWGRIRSPSAATNRFWVQMDGGAWYKWRISVGDIWYWDDFHSDVDYGTPLRFELAAGNHELVIANCVDGVALDRLYISASGDEPEGNDTECNPPHSIQIGGICLPSCGSLRGTRCSPSICADRPLLAAYDCTICCQVEP